MFNYKMWNAELKNQSMSSVRICIYGLESCIYCDDSLLDLVYIHFICKYIYVCIYI